MSVFNPTLVGRCTSATCKSIIECAKQYIHSDVVWEKTIPTQVVTCAGPLPWRKRVFTGTTWLWSISSCKICWLWEEPIGFAESFGYCSKYSVKVCCAFDNLALVSVLVMFITKSVKCGYVDGRFCTRRKHVSNWLHPQHPVLYQCRIWHSEFLLGYPCSGDLGSPVTSCIDATATPLSTHAWSRYLCTK